MNHYCLLSFVVSVAPLVVLLETAAAEKKTRTVVAVAVVVQKVEARASQMEHSWRGDCCESYARLDSIDPLDIAPTDNVFPHRFDAPHPDRPFLVAMLELVACTCDNTV